MPRADAVHVPRPDLHGSASIPRHCSCQYLMSRVRTESMHAFILWTIVVIVGVIAGFYAIFGVWRAWGAWRIRRAGPRPLASIKHVLWRDPGDVARLDLARGPGGPDHVPTPPFHFVEEHFGGSNPSVSVRDARGRLWR